jgi:hypothetical protein
MPSTAPVTRNPAAIADAHSELLAACQTHLGAHGPALSAAAGYTAGEAGARQARRLCADIAAARRWHAAFARRLRTLRGLLHLEHLDDPNSPYTVPVAVLDPDPARVAACCWHVERLDALIDLSAAISARVARLPRRPARRPLRAA